MLRKLCHRRRTRPKKTGAPKDGVSCSLNISGHNVKPVTDPLQALYESFLKKNRDGRSPATPATWIYDPRVYQVAADQSTDVNDESSDDPTQAAATTETAATSKESEEAPNSSTQSPLTTTTAEGGSLSTRKPKDPSDPDDGDDDADAEDDEVRDETDPTAQSPLNKDKDGAAANLLGNDATTESSAPDDDIRQYHYETLDEATLRKRYEKLRDKANDLFVYGPREERRPRYPKHDQHDLHEPAALYIRPNKTYHARKEYVEQKMKTMERRRSSSINELYWMDMEERTAIRKAYRRKRKRQLELEAMGIFTTDPPTKPSTTTIRTTTLKSTTDLTTSKSSSSAFTTITKGGSSTTSQLTTDSVTEAVEVAEGENEEELNTGGDGGEENLNTEAPSTTFAPGANVTIITTTSQLNTAEPTGDDDETTTSEPSTTSTTSATTTTTTTIPTTQTTTTKATTTTTVSTTTKSTPKTRKVDPNAARRAALGIATTTEDPCLEYFESIQTQSPTPSESTSRSTAHTPEFSTRRGSGDLTKFQKEIEHRDLDIPKGVYDPPKIAVRMTVATKLRYLYIRKPEGVTMAFRMQPGACKGRKSKRCKKFKQSVSDEGFVWDWGRKARNIKGKSSLQPRRIHYRPPFIYQMSKNTC